MLRQNSDLTAFPEGKNLAPANQSSPAPLNHRGWKSAYDDALRETDTFQLFKLVEIAEAAILTRLDALAGGPDHRVERQALEDALHTLKRLKIDRLKFD